MIIIFTQLLYSFVCECLYYRLIGGVWHAVLLTLVFKIPQYFEWNMPGNCRFLYYHMLDWLSYYGNPRYLLCACVKYPSAVQIRL